MKRLAVGLAMGAAALVCAGGAHGADERLLVEDFEGPGGAFNPRFNHAIEDLLGAFAEWAVTDEIVINEDLTIPLPSNMLMLRNGKDTMHVDLSGVGNFINAASVDVQDLEGGFAGTSTATVIFHGEFGDISVRPPDTAQIYTLSVTRDDIVDGRDSQPLGSILSIEVHGVWAYFDNITVDVGHRHCPCDFNDNSRYDVQDIYDFLFDWSMGEEGEAADFNEDGEITVQDIYDFLQCWNEPATWPLPFCP